MAEPTLACYSRKGFSYLKFDIQPNTCIHVREIEPSEMKYSIHVLMEKHNAHVTS